MNQGIYIKMKTVQRLVFGDNDLLDSLTNSAISISATQ